MSFETQELRIKSKDPEKQIEEIRRWAKGLVEQLNYALNHLDDTNFVEGISKNVAGTEITDVVQEALNDQYRELRTLTIARTKGKASVNEGNAQLGDIKMCWGVVEVKPTAENESSFTEITFPFPYTNKPNVQVSCENTDPGIRVLGVSYDDLTLTGCKVYVTRTNTTTTKVSWIAIGK